MGKHVTEVAEPELLPVIGARRLPWVVRAAAWILMIPLVLVGSVAAVGSGLYLSGHLRVATVISGSMEPTIPTGSLVLGWDLEPELDAVVMGTREDGVFVTHRVVEVLPDGAFRMRGDANPSPDVQVYSGDSWTVFAHVPHAGEAVRWVIDEPLALIGGGALAGVILAGAFRLDCRDCRAIREGLESA